MLMLDSFSASAWVDSILRFLGSGFWGFRGLRPAARDSVLITSLGP